MYRTPVNTRFEYVVVLDGYRNLFQKKCLNKGEANTLLEEKRKEYPVGTPGHDYQVTIERF